MTTRRAATTLENASKSATASKQAGRSADGAASATCPRCAATFVCAANASSCWCEALPVLDLTRRPKDLLGKGCLCQACLHAAITQSSTAAAVAR